MLIIVLLVRPGNDSLFSGGQPALPLPFDTRNCILPVEAEGK
jgi:hypothetical protein